MLRLCHGLDRFSVDLDFWMADPKKASSVFAELRTYLSRHYSVKDAAEKFYSLVFEVRSPSYPQSLKIEIRKQPRKVETEQAIAYSPFSTTQVLLRVVTLKEMMVLKTDAFLNRAEIRDVFDMEFLVKRGVPPVDDRSLLLETKQRIQSFSNKDYAVKLGSLLDPEKRRYYREHNFRILLAAIQTRLDAFE